MASDSMFDILVGIPLFRGVTRERMAQAVGSAKFHFLKYGSGERIADTGQACTHVRFVIAGNVKVAIANQDARLVIQQTLNAPDVICPDFLFGLSTVYPGNVTAGDDGASIVQISKNDYMKILHTDEIYMYNLLNYLSMNAQKCVEGVLSLTGGNIEQRIAMWIIGLTQPTATDIRVVVKHRDLYAMLGVQRTSYIAALDRLTASGAITWEPGLIQVVDRRKLLDILRTTLE